MASVNSFAIPVACTPSMRIQSYGSAGGTFEMRTVTPASGSTTWTLGSSVMSCSVSGSSSGTPQTCSVTADSPLAQNTVVTIVAPPQGALSAAYLVFSCF